MNYVSVDFSLNSPGIFIYQEETNEYHFISYIKEGQGTKKEILRLAELDVNEINIPFNVYDSLSNSKYNKQIKTLKKKYKDI